MTEIGVFREFRERLRVSRATETTGTALRPLTRSSAVGASTHEEHLVFCSTASGSVQRPGKPPDAFHKFTGERSYLSTPNPSAVSGQCQRCQRPSLRSGPVLFEVARARRTLLLL